MATQESNPFENLPQDLITDILSRLSVKSLLRLRCVSKSWLSLISSPEFQTNYLEVSTTRRRRLVFGSATKLYTWPLHGISYEDPPVDDAPCDFTDVHRYHSIHIVGSCNGLVCLVNLHTGHIFVWNPAIRKYRKLPFPLRLSSREPYGFFYDASSDDYKVVHIVEEPNSRPYSRTYSLRNDSWKSSDWSHGRTPFGGTCVFLNGAIHWIVGYNDNGAKVMAVEAQSLATGELIWSVALPLKRWAFLQVLGERLCACFQCGFRIEVWVMKEYGVEKSWSKVFCLDESGLRRRPLLVTEKGVVTTKTFKRSISFIFLENDDVLRHLKCRYVTATTYGESFVNPNKTW
ncbi:F-box/kelch-repeat protein At3g23880-like [Primulina tabacum]|uniref:F-box/kelch-repeat protein At3g23880-like n=1 Tax=Primulina tabacum TaxID=48773 RepID=UPI003F5A8709